MGAQGLLEAGRVGAEAGGDPGQVGREIAHQAHDDFAAQPVVIADGDAAHRRQFAVA